MKAFLLDWGIADLFVEVVINVLPAKKHGTSKTNTRCKSLTANWSFWTNL